MAIDIDQLIADIKGAASGILNADVSAFRGFSQHQVTAIAQQAAMVAAGMASGQITSETRDFFLNGIEDMTTSFAQTLRGLVAVTIERVLNAVVAVVFKAISAATGAIIPLPIH